MQGGALGVYIAYLVFRAFPTNPGYSIEGTEHDDRRTTHRQRPVEDHLQADADIGYEAFFDGDGVFRWRPEPALNLSTADPVVTIRGEAGGVLKDLDLTYSREPSHNAWTVQSEAANDTAEVVATVYDNDPASLTYYYGPFGPKPADVVRSKTITTTADALAAAEAQGRRPGDRPVDRL